MKEELCIIACENGIVKLVLNEVINNKTNIMDIMERSY